MKKGVLLAIIAAVVIGFFVFDLQQWLTLDGMKAGLSRIEALRDQSPILTSAVFLLIYVAVTALSLPGAAVLTLAAGALFGLWWGLLLASFASSIGATLAFLVSRYLLRDSVQQRFGDRLTAVNEGVEKDGAFYLFTLRLVPLFPFFLINLLMGLTPIRTTTFYWVSQVGMLLGTLVYVNAGTQLAQLESLSGILSPTLLASFALLGIFPLIAKKIVDGFQARRVYKGYNKPKQFDRNMIVIGAGAGGLVSAYIAAAVKAKVTLVEVGDMGGDCLNTGCVPSKALLRSAKLAHQMRHADHYGLNSSDNAIPFAQVMARVGEVVKAIEPHDSVERYTDLGVDVCKGYARLIDPWTVEITAADNTTSRLTANNIVLATGASPVVPPLPGLDSVGYLTSETLWRELSQHESIPARMAILGGGPIGCELAQAFRRLGAEVTLVEMAPRLLIREDDEVAAFAQQSLERDGVKVLVGHKAVACQTVDGEKRLQVQGSGDAMAIAFDELICAVGRAPRLTGFGLEELGIKTQRKVDTNQYLQTLYPNIFAAGDVVGSYQLTHVAAHQAWYAAVNALFGRFKKFAVDYRVIPHCTYIDPEVARVGLNEREAREAGIAYEVTRYDLEELDRAIADGAAEGFVKVLTVPGKDSILGACIVGEHAGDILAEFVLAMKHGLGLNKVLGTIHSYPTWAEANKYAAGEWKRANAPNGLLKWVARYHQWMRGGR